MESCPLATVTEGRVSESPYTYRKGNADTEVTSLEEAKSVIAALKARQKEQASVQAYQTFHWRKTLKIQVSLIIEHFCYLKGGSPCKRIKISHILKMFLKVIKSFYCFKFLFFYFLPK